MDGPERARNCTVIYTTVQIGVKLPMHERHGFTASKGRPRLYRIWVAMRQRCSDPKRDGYHRYGGRGIRVCDEWDSSFTAFRDWAVANGYRDDLTLDREDNNGPYSPGNCRWLTAKAQLSNTHRSKMVTVDGVTRNVHEWSQVSGITFSTLYKRFRKGVRGQAFIAPPQLNKKGAAL
jgi:hypothetical protein